MNYKQTADRARLLPFLHGVERKTEPATDQPVEGGALGRNPLDLNPLDLNPRGRNSLDPNLTGPKPTGPKPAGPKPIDLTEVTLFSCPAYSNNTQHLKSFHLVYPLTARVNGAPKMISQQVSPIFPSSPLPSGTWRTPGLSIP